MIDTKFVELINQLKDNMVDINTFREGDEESNVYLDALNETVSRISDMLDNELKPKPSVSASKVYQPIEPINIDHLLEAFRNGEL